MKSMYNITCQRWNGVNKCWIPNVSDEKNFIRSALGFQFDPLQIFGKSTFWQRPTGRRNPPPLRSTFPVPLVKSALIRCLHYKAFLRRPLVGSAYVKWLKVISTPGNTKGGSTTVMFDWLGISCKTSDNSCFYLQNRLIQTSQTGGQWYSDTSPFSIPWAHYLACYSTELIITKKSF